MDAGAAAPMAFDFGRNWSQFVDQHFSPQRVAIASRHLLDFLRIPDLTGRDFLDIGCGSGIHSLAAWQAGARRVVSFDINPASVDTTRRLHRWAGQPGNWTIAQGSILDPGFVSGLGRADIVYSWCVLHHTGALWDAVTAAASTLADDGVFYLALYSKDVYIDPPHEYWLDVKQRYNRAGRWRRRIMEWHYAWRYTIRPALRAGQNPWRALASTQSRGMAYWSDVRDWLGGWPMEFASIAETKAHCRRLGLDLLHLRAGEGNTEYLFGRPGQSHWEALRRQRDLRPLPGPFAHRGGCCWQVSLDAACAASGDQEDAPVRSRLMLYEDDVPLGFPHAPRHHIERFGNGRFLHWGQELYFSASDGSDPNRNGRRYTMCLDGA
jgi:SAM-dependent methyltransferase